MVVGGGSEVLVVGAGPAGSSTAMLLAKANVPVLIVEKEVLPRRKPCGGLISLRALKEAGSVLESHGFPHIPEVLVERVICGVRVMGTDPSEKGTEYWEDDPIGVMVDRSAFDFFLAKRAVEAGAVLLDGLSWRDGLLWSQREGLVERKSGRDAAKVIIGADGALGPTAKTAGMRRWWHRWELGFTLSTEIHVGTRVCDAIAGAGRPGGRGVVEFHCLDGLVGGFGWVFP
ncbi:MAG TPA: NAD(P)-binding protein, partial [Clostridia bacterium]|nr:NAD(P)-binding protein [Clostridia bacterium]